MLLNDFYYTNNERHSTNGLEYDISFRIDHPIFSGHFPDNPIVPGVCMIEITNELVSKAVGAQLTLTEAPIIKFLQLISPDNTPTFHASWSNEGASLKVTASLKRGDIFLFKIHATYTKK